MKTLITILVSLLLTFNALACHEDGDDPRSIGDVDWLINPAMPPDCIEFTVDKPLRNKLISSDPRRQMYRNTSLTIGQRRVETALTR